MIGFMIGYILGNISGMFLLALVAHDRDNNDDE